MRRAPRSVLASWRVAFALILTWGAFDVCAQIDRNVSRAFVVKATIAKGCILGDGATDATSFGVVDFGQVASLPANIDASSTAGAGSVVLHCTPGTTATVSLGTGANVTGSVMAGRLLKNTASAETLRYQLYVNAARSVVWGGGAAGGQSRSITADGSNQELVVFARLFAAALMPSAGTYTDTVLVTVAY